MHMIRGNQRKTGDPVQQSLDQYHQGLAARTKEVTVQPSGLSQEDALTLGEYLDAVDGRLLHKDEALYTAAVEYLGGFLLTCTAETRLLVEAKSWAAKTLGEVLTDTHADALSEGYADWGLRRAG